IDYDGAIGLEFRPVVLRPPNPNRLFKQPRIVELRRTAPGCHGAAPLCIEGGAGLVVQRPTGVQGDAAGAGPRRRRRVVEYALERSEERRVGKECGGGGATE